LDVSVQKYHQRLFTLSLQVNHFLISSLLSLGKWIYRKSTACIDKAAEAQKTLNSCPFTIETLRREWSYQVVAQTKPLVQATATLAKRSIKAILDLKEYSEALANDITDLDTEIEKTVREGGAADELLFERSEIVSKKRSLDRNIEKRQADLGVSEKEDMKKLMNDKYLQARVQAKALKDRIQTKLRNRKFELERLNRVYHQVSASGKSHMNLRAYTIIEVCHQSITSRTMSTDISARSSPVSPSSSRDIMGSVPRSSR